MTPSKRPNRRGFVGDIIIILVYMGAFAIVLLIISLIVSKINDAFQADPAISPVSQQIMATGAAAFPVWANIVFGILLIGLPLVSAGLAYKLEADSIWFWLVIAFSALFVILAGIVSWMWSVVVASSTELADQASLMALVNLIMEHFAVYSLLVIFLICAGLYFKRPGTVVRY